MSVTIRILKSWQRESHRVLLFSQTTQLLDLLEIALQQQNFIYRRIDGGFSFEERQRILIEFESNPTIFLLLLTSRVGGVGLNLVAANRVIIFDPDWNPMTDIQAKERSWRIGQKRDVIIYRLMSTGTIEEKIYHRQIFKQILSKKVLDEPKNHRFFKWTELHNLFEFPPKPFSLDNLEHGLSEFKETYKNPIVELIEDQENKENSLYFSGELHEKLSQSNKIKQPINSFEKEMTEKSLRNTSNSADPILQLMIPKRKKQSFLECAEQITDSDQNFEKKETSKDISSRSRNPFIPSTSRSMNRMNDSDDSLNQRNNSILDDLMKQNETLSESSFENDLKPISSCSFKSDFLTDSINHCTVEFSSTKLCDLKKRLQSSSILESLRLSSKLQNLSALTVQKEKFSWKENITLKLKEVLKNEKPLSSSDIIKRFQALIGTETSKAFEFRKILQKNCDLDPTRGVWVLKKTH